MDQNPLRPALRHPGRHITNDPPVPGLRGMSGRPSVSSRARWESAGPHRLVALAEEGRGTRVHGDGRGGAAHRGAAPGGTRSGNGRERGRQHEVRLYRDGRGRPRRDRRLRYGGRTGGQRRASSVPAHAQAMRAEKLGESRDGDRRAGVEHRREQREHVPVALARAQTTIPEASRAARVRASQSRPCVPFANNRPAAQTIRASRSTMARAMTTRCEALSVRTVPPPPGESDSTRLVAPFVRSESTSTTDNAANTPPRIETQASTTPSA